MSKHVETDKCGFDRNGSLSLNTYACDCGWFDEFTLPQGDLHNPEGINTHPDPWPYFPDPLKTR